MKPTIQEQDTTHELIQHEATMRAVRIRNYGDESVLSYEDAPVPLIGPDEVLIRVHAAAVNPIDWKIRKGLRKEFLNKHNPAILGWDVSGTIEQTGTLVSRFKPGDLVFSNPTPSRNGGYAEYIAVHSFEVAHAPRKISLEHAAGVPLASQTAWEALFEKAFLKPGQSILIHGAAGGVGTFALQFAKLAGAKVFCTCSKNHTDLLHALGADEVIDYHTSDFNTKLNNLDVVLDTIGGQTQNKSYQVLRKGGILVSTVGIDDPAEADKSGVKAMGFFMITNGARLEEIGQLIDKGKVKVIIDKEFPLKDIREAHKLSETRHATGKIILRVE